MPSHSDCFIFVTGVVGRAMGSGKFAAENVKHLTQTAYDAFCEVFGEPIKTNLDAVREAASAKADAPASVGTSKAFGEVAKQVLAAASSSLASSFNSWADQRSWLYGPAKEKTWRELLDYSIENHPEALKALTSGSKQDLSKSDPQYLDRNRERVERCKVVLAMAEQMRAAKVQPSEPNPF